MHFRIAHQFDHISLPDFTQLFFDEAFNQALCSHLKLQRSLVNRDHSEHKLSRQVRIRPDRQIPKIAAGLLEADKLDYLEHLHFHFARGEGEWDVSPIHFPQLIQSSGKIAFFERGGRVERIVEGQVKVSVFGLGKVAEGLIIKELERTYALAAAFTLDYQKNR